MEKKLTEGNKNMAAGEHWFSTDRVLVYAAFCADFGPMNLAAGLRVIFFCVCSVLCFVARAWIWLLVSVVLCFFHFVRTDFGLMDLAAGLLLLCSVSCAMATSSAFEILVFFLFMATVVRFIRIMKGKMESTELKSKKLVYFTGHTPQLRTK